MIQVNHQRGKLLTETNSIVTFYEPGYAGVLLNGQLAASVGISGGFRCTVPAGEYDLTCISPSDVILSEADTFVQGGTNTDTSYGTNTSMMVKDNPDDNYDRRSFVRFELSSITSAVSHAALRLVPTSVGSDSALTVQVLLVPDNTWNESTLTWSTQPSGTTVLATLDGFMPGAPVFVDLTSAVNTARPLADQKLSLVLIVNSPPASARYAQFATKEYTGNAEYRPALQILY
jgi:hypothetical protein